MLAKTLARNNDEFIRILYDIETKKGHYISMSSDFVLE